MGILKEVEGEKVRLFPYGRVVHADGLKSQSTIKKKDDIHSVPTGVVQIEDFLEEDGPDADNSPAAVADRLRHTLRAKPQFVVRQTMQGSTETFLVCVYANYRSFGSKVRVLELGEAEIDALCEKVETLLQTEKEMWSLQVGLMGWDAPQVPGNEQSYCIQSETFKVRGHLAGFVIACNQLETLACEFFITKGMQGHDDLLENMPCSVNPIGCLCSSPLTHTNSLVTILHLAFWATCLPFSLLNCLCPGSNYDYIDLSQVKPLTSTDPDPGKDGQVVAAPVSVEMPSRENAQEDGNDWLDDTMVADLVGHRKPNREGMNLPSGILLDPSKVLDKILFFEDSISIMMARATSPMEQRIILTFARALKADALNCPTIDEAMVVFKKEGLEALEKKLMKDHGLKLVDEETESESKDDANAVSRDIAKFIPNQPLEMFEISSNEVVGSSGGGDIA